jgi:hypothetical protein
MCLLHANATIQHTSERLCVPNLPAAVSVRDIDCLKHLLESPPLDLAWDDAIRAAAARLKESWLLPETRNHPAVAALAVELAAFLCAYGLLADEVRRGRAQADNPAVVTQPTEESRGGTLWSEPPGFAIATDSAPNLGPLLARPGVDV